MSHCQLLSPLKRFSSRIKTFNNTSQFILLVDKVNRQWPHHTNHKHSSTTNMVFWKEQRAWAGTLKYFGGQRVMKVHTLEYVEAGVILPYNSSMTRTSQMEALIQTLYNKLSSNGWCLVLLHFFAIQYYSSLPLLHWLSCMMNTKDIGGDKLSGKLFNDLPFGDQAQFMVTLLHIVYFPWSPCHYLTRIISYI